MEKNTDRSISNDFIDASQITRNVYLGSYEKGAKSYNGLKVLGITHNLIIGHIEQMPIPYPSEFIYKFIELPDHHKANITDFFDECIEFLNTAISENPETHILVDCFAGISRSATIVIAYLIKNMCFNYLEAFETVRKARHWINPNKGFREQLIKWSENFERSNSENNIEEYDRARFLLKKMNEKGINFAEEMQILESFSNIFGEYHIHTIDIGEELLLRV